MTEDSHETQGTRREKSGRPARRVLFHAPEGWGWTVLAIAAGLVLTVLFVTALRYFVRPLALMALGVAIAAALAPLVSRLEKRMPRVVAAVLVFAGVLLVFAAIIGTIIPAVIQQAQEFIGFIPQIVENLQEWYNQFGGDIPIIETLFGQLGQLGGSLVAVPLGLASAVVQILLVLFIALYALLEAPRLKKFISSLFPSDRREQVSSVLAEMAQAMGGFVRGTVIIAALVGLITFIGLTIIGVPFALVLALIAGTLELLPYVGPILAIVPMLLVALLESPTQALIVLVFFGILQQLESNVFVPNIMHSQTEISPLLAVFAIVGGGSVGGLLGALVAIPIASALQVFVVRVIAPEIRRQTGAEGERGDRVGESDGSSDDE
jgi:putative heme transporter